MPGAEEHNPELTTTVTAHTQNQPAVIARDLEVVGEYGTVFGPLDLVIPGEGLTFITGRGGSGRTALALCLSGRMKPSKGELSVLGETKARRIAKFVAIAGVDVIDELDRDVKIQDVLTEHLNFSRKFYQPRANATEEYYRFMCQPVFGERDLPPMGLYISQVSELDRLLIRISLSLHPVTGEEIRMLVMDDLGQVREQGDREILLQILSRLSHTMPVIVNAVQLPQPAPPHTHVEILADPAHVHPVHTGQPSQKPTQTAPQGK